MLLGEKLHKDTMAINILLAYQIMANKCLQGLMAKNNLPSTMEHTLSKVA